MSKRTNTSYYPETNAIYSQVLRQEFYGSVITPIFHGTLVDHPDPFEYMDTRYPRFNTLPNHLILQDKLARLEGADGAVVAASGMAAISGAMLCLLSKGDHVLLTENLYGGTDAFVTEDFERLGFEYDFVDITDATSWEKAVKSNTAMFYTETASNPRLDIPDHDALIAFAKKHGLLTLIDATFTTPVSYRPCENGYDIVIQSATKYLNGHSDLAAGVVAGRQDLVDKIRHGFTHLGGSLDPQRCYLFERGLKTLFMRVRHQNENAMKVAMALEGNPHVERVIYPGLPSHPQHELAKKYYSGYGSMIGVILKGGVEVARQLGKHTKLIPETPSLGGLDSNFTLPADTVHQSIGEEARKRSVTAPELIRLSVGAEDYRDIVSDLEQAIERLYV